ncbi:MAG: histidine kinase, partial [Bacteroidota bacterium]
MIIIFKFWNQTNIKNKELEKINLENRMQLLRNQIHPHFLFNTLNNLYSLAVDRSDKVPEIIIRISDILRYILKEHNKEIVTLKEELDIIYTYIDLEKLRYG